MLRDRLPEFISALVDREVADLHDDEVELLQRIVHGRPAYGNEFRCMILTKQCVCAHIKPVHCPSSLEHAIRSALYHLYLSRLAAS